MKNKHTRKRVKIERGTWKGEWRTNPSSTLFEFSWIYLLFFISKTPFGESVIRTYKEIFLRFLCFFCVVFSGARNPHDSRQPSPRLRYLVTTHWTFLLWLFSRSSCEKVLENSSFLWELVFDLWNVNVFEDDGEWWGDVRPNRNFSMTQPFLCHFKAMRNHTKISVLSHLGLVRLWLTVQTRNLSYFIS
jgi:hypothetical protein